MLIAGGMAIAISVIPTWIGIIVCVIVLAFTAVAVIKASAAADVVETIDDKIKVQTSFIKETTSEAEVLFNNASNEFIKADCKKVYDALRYSDPMTSEGLKDIEEMIKREMSVFAETVSVGNKEDVSVAKDRLLSLINNRNTKCKSMK